MTTWYVTHNEQIFGSALCILTIFAVIVGYCWWEITQAEDAPDERPTPRYVDTAMHKAFVAGEVIDFEPREES